MGNKLYCVATNVFLGDGDEVVYAKEKLMTTRLYSIDEGLEAPVDSIMDKAAELMAFHPSADEETKAYAIDDFLSSKEETVAHIKHFLELHHHEIGKHNSTLVVLSRAARVHLNFFYDEMFTGTEKF